MITYFRNACLKARQNVLWREIDGEIVVLDPEKGLYYGIEGAGVFIWRYIQEKATLQDIAVSLVNALADADEKTVREDVLRFSNELAGAGLIEVMEN